MVTKGKVTSSRMAVSCNLAKEWVKLHYERDADGVVAKAVMYKHYEDECRALGRPLMETSIFGRIVKSIFPDVHIRRLGGRDNLKYYYCGIQVKPDSKYYADNATTTRPKRKLRKRELVTDKTDVISCIRWLCANYATSPEKSVVKADVYDSYAQNCASMNTEPLSIQYFGMVITHAFPRVTKRKLGPRANQQKYYFGIEARTTPLPVDNVPNDFLVSTIQSVFNKGRLDYREGLEDEDEEDHYCQSPMSDTVDLSPHRQEPLLDEPAYNHVSSLIKQERIEENFSNIELKDEPLDDNEDIELKPLDLPLDLSIPDRPSSATTYGSSSPSPPVKENRTTRKLLFKPRLHFFYREEENSWNGDTDLKSEKEDVSYCDMSMNSDRELRQWLEQNLEENKNGLSANRDQIYEFYERDCFSKKQSPLPICNFDIATFNVFGNNVTTRICDNKTYYEGIRINDYSPLRNYVDEIITGGSLPEYPCYPDNDMEMSPSNEYASHNSQLDSPLPLEDEDDEPPDEILPSYPHENDLLNTPEVLRDGKFYLKMWLNEHFESVPNSCVLKADAYKHYDKFARLRKQMPFEMNVFGKIVRQVFPDVTIRRLGGRIRPQYHYCGIGVKRDSPLYNLMSGKDPVQRSRKKEIATDNRSAEIVIEWLRHNYMSGKEKLILKCEVFNRYTVFCAQSNETPVTVNYFGKLVKHCFPDVEVRKFGGRTDPTWYYHGLVPVNGGHHNEASGGASSVSQDDLIHDRNSIPYDLQMSQSASRGLSPCHLIPVTREEQHYHPHHSSSPIPITINNSNNHLGTPITGSYGSPSVIVISNSRSASQSPLVCHQNLPCQQPSPRNRENYMMEQKMRPTEQLYVDPPPDSHHSFRETIGSISPAEGGGLKELSRRFVTRSPYESADVPPENIYSRSPGDTAAQISRSPGSVLSPHHSYQNTPEITQNHQDLLTIRSPKDTILFSRSPIEGVLTHEGQQRIRVSLANNGCQVVPSQTPPGVNVTLTRCLPGDQGVVHLPHLKRHKGQLQIGSEYEMMRDMSLK